MPYGTIKVDNITFTDNSVDKTVSLSGLIQNPTFTGNVTVTGTISGDVIRGGTTISGVTVTGTTANFVSGVFTTQLSGATILANTGNFTSLTGTTTTGTTANFVSGVFTTQLSGATITGTTANFTSGNFTSLSGTTTTVTSGVFSAGSVTAPSVAVGIGTTYKPGIYSPGTDQLAISTNGTSRIVVDASGNVNIDSNTFYVDAANNYVGIGNTSPASELDVKGEIRIYPASGNATVRFGSGGVEKGKIAVDSSSNLLIETAGSERGRIDSSGRLIVGIIASPAHQLQVSTDSAGKPSTSTWTIVSDERIKEDIELADLDLCYEAIKAIPLKRYKWRDEIYTTEQVTDRRKLGWIAQDVETVFPKAVGTHEFKYNQVFEETIIPAVEEELDADGNVITPAQPERTEQGDLISEDVIEDCRNLNSDQIYAAMYGAVQKLMAKVEALEASNADLLARVAALEAA